MSKENDEVDFIDVLDDEDRQKYLMVLGAATLAVVSALGVRGVIILVVAAVFLSSRKPGNTAFLVYFQRFVALSIFELFTNQSKGGSKRSCSHRCRRN
jgi:hypothetical protein